MEQNFGDFANTYAQGFWIGGTLLFILAIVRTYLLWKNKANRHFLFATSVPGVVRLLKLIFLAGLIMMLVNIPVWFVTVATFVPFVDKLPYGFFLVSLVYITLQETIFCFSASDSLIQQFIKRILFVLISIFCSSSFILAGFIVPGTYKEPSEENAIALQMPVNGTWRALHAGTQTWVNYHAGYPNQQYGMDWVKVDEQGKFFANSGADPSDFYTFRDSVFAPCNAVVVASCDTLPARPLYHSPDTLNASGNYVILSIGNENYLFFEHLYTGSLLVQTGDTLKAGAFIGLAGNSGNTSFPHLHMHVQNTPIINDSLAKGLPFYLTQTERKRWCTWSEPKPLFLVRNDLIRRK